MDLIGSGLGWVWNGLEWVGHHHNIQMILSKQMNPDCLGSLEHILFHQRQRSTGVTNGPASGQEKLMLLLEGRSQSSHSCRSWAGAGETREHWHEFWGWTHTSPWTRHPSESLPKKIQPRSRPPLQHLVKRFGWFLHGPVPTCMPFSNKSQDTIQGRLFVQLAISEIGSEF